MSSPSASSPATSAPTPGSRKPGSTAAFRASSAGPRVQRRRGRIQLWHLGWYAVMVVVAICCLGPLLWMVATSARPADTAFIGPVIPRVLTFVAYSFDWTQVHIWRGLLNSVFITLVTLVLVLACATLAGYAIGLLRFTGRRLVFGVMASALFLPGVAILIPVYVELKQLHLLGSQLGLILVYTGGGVPFAILILRTFFESLPVELTEAARIDGAGEFQIFSRVILPLAGPGLATVATFQMLTTWNELLFASALITDGNSLPIQPTAQLLIGQYATNWPALTAAMTLAVVPMLITYFLFQKYFVAGMTAGAVK